MITHGALILSILLQFFAAVMALSLTKKTKYNASWILISISFLFMAFRRAIDLLPFYFVEYTQQIIRIQSWMGVLTSILIAIGVIYIKKIFSFLEKLDQIRKDSEKRVLHAIIRTEENQKKRFAKDLHDGLGPLLSTAKMSISALEESNRNESQEKILANTHMVINEAINAIKEISNDISPHILTNLGLESALRSFIQKIPLKNGCQIHFTYTLKGKRLEYSTEVILYRVICELINNSLKHANANNMNLDIWHTSNLLNVKYSDDGIGFNTDNIVQIDSTGMGLHNMKSRIKSLNGTLDMISQPMNGIQVTIELPLGPLSNKETKRCNR